MLWLLALLYLMGFAAAVLPVKSPANRVETADDRWTDEIGIVFSENHAKNLFSPALQVQARILCRSKTPTG